MTEGFNPTALHEALDREGRLDDAHGPGCYALRASVPSDVEAAHRRWLEQYESVPDGELLEELAGAPRTCYVGASGDVYDRLMDHAEASVRKAGFLQVFPPEEVVGVWPSDTPFDAERSRAYSLRDEGWVCWVDGGVVG